MSAGGEKASRRVEILAIVVGGVVGLAGILVTLASSRDAQKATENAQRISARATRERADLTELRCLLVDFDIDAPLQ